MAITLIGLNHKTASIELRERLHVPEEKIPGALKRLKELVPECLLFSTCNRFEILASHESLERAREELVSFISEYREIPRQEFETFLYFHAGSGAIHHLFRVTSSLDSMVVGESQILGQMKRSYSMAQQEKSIGFLLNACMEKAFMVAKKVRNETLIATNAVSVSSVAVELARKIFSQLEGRTAFIIGAGKMSGLAVRHLRAHGLQTLFVTNRTQEKAVEMAQQMDGTAVPFESIPETLSRSDIVISSTGSTQFIINKQDVQHALGQRKNQPIFLIDIAVPRDIDPKVNQLDNCFLYDIDDLKSVSDINRKEREKEADKAEELVIRESEIFWNRIKTLDIAPTIREIQNYVEALRQKEVERSLKKLGPLSAQQKEAIDNLTASLTSKILQNSFSELKQLINQPDGVEKIELIKKLFRMP